MFTHLHVHSHYSLLTAPARIDDLLDQAKAFGMTALAITDYTALYGAVELSIKAKERGMKPIIGAEVYVTKDMRSRATSEDRRRYNLVLLATNETGYRNLMHLISDSHIEGFYYKARVDKACLEKYHEGLIALSGSVTGEVPSLLVAGSDERAKETALEYDRIFGRDNFYLELQPHADYENQMIANAGLIRIARETGIPLVATNDVHYVRPEENELQDILFCIQNNWQVSNENRLSLRHLDLSLRSPEDMKNFFHDIPEAIENAEKIADRCNVTIRLGETQLPHFDVPDGFDAMSYLRKLSGEGLERRFGGTETEEHRTRMEYELDVIEKTGFASYFLIVQDFVNWAKRSGILVGPGRGSAAGSFIAYLTGITNMDPVKYHLLFERFLNPERISMPDVDMDFADDRRDDVLNYVRERYGHDHVAQIITFGTMAARAAIRDAGRALGYSYADCDRIAKLIPQFHSIKKALDEAPDFKALYSSDANSRRLIDIAQKIEGLARHASMHACGVVITKDPVTEYTPIQNISGSKEGTVTQYSSSTKSSYVEKIGLLKMDFLGLKNLTIIQDALRIVKALDKRAALLERLHLNENATASDIMDALPLDDEQAFKLLQDAKTTGVFQLESSGMKKHLKHLAPTVLEDIIAMVALYRPGPMEWIPDFIDGKHGRKTVEYLHPKLEPILGATYGVAVYQEQVMQIARDLAGFTLGEADVLRKAMGKKIIDLIQEQKIKFIDGCIKQGISKTIGEKVFSFIEPFAGYGFNRSHAACYGLIGYQTAFLKAHYPAEFMAALLTSDQDNSDRIAIEVAEARDMGVPVLPPDVNESFEEFSVVRADGDKSEKIRFGLNAVKNVGKTVAEEIVRERKANGHFADLTNFIERVRTKDLNKKSLDALIKVGALERFGERNRMLASIDTILLYAKNLERTKATHSMSLFRDMPIEKTAITLVDAPPAQKADRLGWEKELLGLYVSDHPTSDYREYLDTVALSVRDAEHRQEGEVVTIGGVVASSKKLYTNKDQKLMFFATIEDTTGHIEAIVFPRTAEQTEHLWEPDTLVFVEGKISLRDGAAKILVEKASRIAPDAVEQWKRIEATKKKHERIQTPENNQQETENEKTQKKDERSRINHSQKSQPSNHSAIQQSNNPAIQLTDNQLTISIDDRSATPKTIERIAETLKALPTGNTKVYLRLRGATIETAFSIVSDTSTLEHLHHAFEKANKH